MLWSGGVPEKYCAQFNSNDKNWSKCILFNRHYNAFNVPQKLILIYTISCQQFHYHMGNSTVTDVTFREVDGHFSCPNSYSGTPRNLALCMRLANVQVYLVPQRKVSRSIYGFVGNRKYVRDGRYIKRTWVKTNELYFKIVWKP